jgi:HEAT repeat protein
MLKNIMDDQDINTEVTEEDLGVVQDIIRTITKTVKTFNVYPKDNPIYHKFATELFEKFNAFFESGDELRIDIEQYSLLYKESEVYRSEEKTDNLAMLLFSDGLRQITFQKGITSEEISDFIDILRFAPKSVMSDDDDIVTLLWEKNIKNMGYTAVEDTVDDDLVVEEALLRNDTGEEISRGPSEETGALFAPAASVFSSETKVEPLTESELAAFKKELSDIDEKLLLSSAVGLFFGLLTDEEDTEAFPEIVQNIGRIMDIRMQRKDLRGAIQILEGLKGFLEVYNTPSQREIIEQVISRAGSLDNLQVLFGMSQDPVEIRQCLLLLGTQSLTQMIQVLSELNDRKQRRLLCEILAEIGKQDIDALAEALNNEKWYLVRNIVMVLGMTKDPDSVKHLEKVLNHKDARVRRETIRALEGISSGETKDLFIVALEDSDVAVRIAALRALRRLKAPGLFEVLSRNISRDELRKKPFAEKKELLETIAVLGGEEAFPLLSELFKKKGLIEKEEITEIRASAAYGLGLLKSKEAILMLEKETDSKKSLLRESCIKALGKS